MQIILYSLFLKNMNIIGIIIFMLPLLPSYIHYYYY